MTLDAEGNTEKNAESTGSLLKCLTECPNGAALRVVSVSAGRGAKQRLANLGIVPGVKIKKTKSGILRGPVEVIVRGSNIVLGRGLAVKVMVK